MEKFKVIDPEGFYFDKQKHPLGAVIDLPPGPCREAALRFKQVEPVKEKTGEKK